MDIQSLIHLLAAHPRVRELADAVTSARRRMTVGGLSGSSAALAFAALTQRTVAPFPLLFVLDSEDEAGYFYHDLVQMVGESQVLFFPSSFRRAIKYNQRDAANEVLRTEVLAAVATRAAGLYVVTYPEALAERVVERRALADHTLRLSRGGREDFASLGGRLDALGFKCVDYVYEPGQYALRGSLVDIFSYASDTPVRVDFFGDDIESVRTFDVQTQLTERTVDEVDVVPELQGGADGASSRVPVLRFFPPGTLVVTRSAALLAERVRAVAAEGFAQQAVLEERAKGLPEYEREPLASAAVYRAIVSGGDEFAETLEAVRQMEIRSAADSSCKSDITFDTTAQPLFHKQFDLLAEELRRRQAEGYRLFILADSGKQIERLSDILAADEGTRGITFEGVERTIHEGFIDHTLRLCLFTDHQVFDRFHKYNLKSERARRGKVALTLRELRQFGVGDYVVHIDHGVGRFGGLVRMPTQDGGVQEMIKITYQNDDTVYVSIHALHKISKYKGKDGEPPRVSRLGTGAWERMKERVKARVKDIARDLIRLYSSRLQERGYAFSRDTLLQHELEASFLYEDTPDQLRATQDVKADMERERPMDRLVCGDVGFGKTEVAVRAAFKAAADGKQTAVLVPTTVLAYQHFQTFTSRLKAMPVRVDYLSRSRTASEQRALLADLAAGHIDIIIGTHKLIGKSVRFHDLGLLIIDEEQKFGVSVKERLRQMKASVNTLTMTATPIPRTLQFSLMGARDLSVIQTPPPNRYPIQTEVHTFSDDIIADAVNFEMSRGGQVFFVNNRISNLPQIEATLHRLVPDARICTGHGRMDPKELEQKLLDFVNHDYDILLSTTIVENGIDVPNANTIIINGADHYGLSDLHQMRGRVGRGNKKAFCYLLAPPLAALPDDTRRRLQAVEDFSDLGSGLHIAMQDLDIRGAGNMLGAEQSGFIADLGYETYQRILAEAMQELRNEAAPGDPSAVPGDPSAAPCAVSAAPAPAADALANVAWADTAVESDIPAYFPDNYVAGSPERMSLYRELDSLTTQGALDAYRARLTDRFGPLPPEAEELLRVMPLKWVASRLGVERLTLRQHRLTCYLVAQADSPYYRSDAFGRVIAYATQHPRQCRLREVETAATTRHGAAAPRRLIAVEGIDTVARALDVLTAMDHPPRLAD